MSHKPNAVPVLQEGTVYTIILDNGRKVHDVIYHACVASGKSYFAKGDKTYPAEKVRNHSITGHAAAGCLYVSKGYPRIRHLPACNGYSACCNVG